MRKTVKKLTAVGLTVTSVLGLVACGSSKGTTSQGTSENKEVTKPDTFTVMCDGTVVTETNGAEAFYKQLNEATGLDIKWTRPDHASYYDAVAKHLTQTIPCQTLYCFHLIIMHCMHQTVSFGI